MRADRQASDRGHCVVQLIVRKSSRHRGFSLIELMVAMVVGLIVVGAVLALVVSIMKSNRQTLQSTRLNQEMRATLAVIASELRRARSVDDPLTQAVNANEYADVDTDTAQCIRYGYFDVIDDNNDGDPDNDNFHWIRLLNGGLERASAEQADDLACDSPDDPDIWKPLGSNQVDITDIEFQTPPTASPNPAADSRRFTVTITANLRDRDTELNSVSRTMSQEIFVRSVGTGI